MDHQAQWDAWCRRIVADYFDGAVQIIAEETGAQDKKLQSRIAKLRAELLLLWAQVAALQRSRARAAITTAKKLTANHGHR